MIGGCMSTHRDRAGWGALGPAQFAAGSGSRHGAAMHLLASGVPLSLIMDLAVPRGPRSQEILLVEGCPDDPWWERR